MLAPVISAWVTTRKPGWIVGACFVVVTTGLITAGAPPTIISLTSLVFLVPLVVVRPYLALVIAVGLESTRLVPEIIGFPSFFVTGIVALLLTFGAFSAAFRNPLPVRRSVPAILILTAITGGGTVTQILSSPWLHVATTANLVVAPILAVLIARGITRAELSWVLRAAIVLLVLNAAACVGELVAGGDALISMGLEYGTIVRHIDGVLRTPGLTLSSATVGMLSAAAMLAISLLGPDRLLSRAWIATGLLAGGVVLVLSTSRSGAILFVVGSVLGQAIFQLRAGTGVKGSRAWRVLAIALAAVVPLAMVRYGASSMKSLFQRFDVWSNLADNYVSFWGLGAGRVGASSYAETNPYPPIFADNSWLSLLIQYGLLGFILIVATYLYVLMWSLRKALRGCAHAGRLSGLLMAAGASGLLIEITDYTGCMILLATTGTFLFGALQDTQGAESAATASTSAPLHRHHPRTSH